MTERNGGTVAFGCAVLFLALVGALTLGILLVKAISGLLG